MSWPPLYSLMCKSNNTLDDFVTSLLKFVCLSVSISLKVINGFPRHFGKRFAQEQWAVLPPMHLDKELFFS